jgi:hypothetical protein
VSFVSIESTKLSGRKMRRDFLKILSALSGLGLIALVGFMTNSRRKKSEEKAQTVGFTTEPKPVAEPVEESIEDYQEYLDRFASSPQYMRPPNDPLIAWDVSPDRGNPNKGKMLDTTTGDYFDYVVVNREQTKVYCVFFNKAGEFVCQFAVKLGPGKFGKGDWPLFPIRVYETYEAQAETMEVKAARSRISIKRLAQFLTVVPSLNSFGGTNFVVIDEPLPLGEPL